MKKNLLRLAVVSWMLVTMSATVNAQWTRNAVPSPAHTYLTNTTDNLGIGTTTPAFKLDVQGTGITTMSFKSTTDNASILLDRGASNKSSSLTYRTAGVNNWQTGCVSNNNYTIRNNSLAQLTLHCDYLTNNVGIGTNVPANKLSVAGNADFTGNVGIGTTTPGAKLDVVGNIKITDGTQAAGKVLTSDANGLATWQTPAGGGSGWGLTGNAATTSSNFMGTTDNRSLRFRTNNTEKVIIDSLGRVGIGTTTPLVDLSIGAPGNHAFLAGYGISTTKPIGVVNGTGGLKTTLLTSDNLNGCQLGAYDYGTGTGLPLKINASGGNVGIGTFTPYANLTVGTPGNHAFMSIYGISTTKTFGVVNGTGGLKTTLITSGPGGGSIDTYDYAVGPMPLTICPSGGNVSIGSVNPATGYKLTVAGKIICTELKVQLQPFPDYVFAKDYNLKSIDEVEQHINTYNRLPGMPGACEVEEGGMSVGEMTGKVVEKVEENTLYIIQLNKENQLLKTQLNDQAKAIQAMQAQLDLMKK